ncbi:MAG: hypothetical protein NFCOHLIN_01902 [Gammaproteobacteria bacterium]|nr:hypothetical protein [Gammaproteobacteria bacterium]
MNTIRSLEHRHPVTGSPTSPMSGSTGCTLHKAVGAASTAVVIGIALASTAYADPATRAPAATVELAGYELPPRGYQCVPVFHGKYTGWRCEQESAAIANEAVARTP